MTGDETTGRAARVAARFLQDLMLEGTADYWDRRAATIATVAPRTGDHPGQDSAAGHVRRVVWSDEAARACRSRAHWIRSHGADPSILNEAEQWVHDRPSHGIPPLELERETATQMIARHQRVLAALDHHKTAVLEPA